MRSRFDIIVVGAGIAGVSAASALATEASVLLLDMEAQPGYHATGRSAAFFAPTYGNATVRNLTAASETFFRSPPAGFSDAALLYPRSALFIGREGQRASMSAMQEEIPSLRLLDAAAVRDRVSLIRPSITGGLLDEQGGDIDVDALLQGFLRRFRERGGEIRTRFSVDALQFVDGLWCAGHKTGQVRAPILVNAAGAWADEVAVRAGVASVGLAPKRRTALLIDPPTGVQIADWPLVIDVDEQFYFKPDAGRLLISPADETPSVPCDARPDEFDIAVAIDRVQAVAAIDVRMVRHSWAGLRTFAPDRTFVVGFEPNCPGFFWLAGQGGYGVQTSPAMAELARCLIAGTQPEAVYRGILDTVPAVSVERFRR